MDLNGVHFVSALAAPFLLIISHYILRSGPKHYLSHCLSVMPVYTWLAVFLWLPRKDVNFLIPVLPLIHLCAILSYGLIGNIFDQTIKSPTPNLPGGFPISSRFRAGCKRDLKFVYNDITYFSFLSIIIMYVMIRSLWMVMTVVELWSLFDKVNRIHQEHGFNVSDATYNICTSKEWNFPSMYFLLSSNSRLRLIKLRQFEKLKLVTSKMKV